MEIGIDDNIFFVAIKYRRFNNIKTKATSSNRTLKLKIFPISKERK
jgi:hypothetical protein